MRDYTHIDKYLDELEWEIYPQPEDPGHTAWSREFIWWCHAKTGSEGGDDILDVGCGEGFARQLFEEINLGYTWKGITLGSDYKVCKAKNLPVRELDMSFIHLPGSSFDVVYARHVLEHSPIPLLTLMEWRRVSNKYLWLCAPAPEYWGIFAKNHYSVFDKPRLWHMLRRAGWDIVHEGEMRTNQKIFLDQYMPEVKDTNARRKLSYPGHPIPVEYWFICQKGEPKIA